MRRANTATDFWARVARGEADECWEWTKRRDRDGYGLLSIAGRCWRAHRAAYFFATGDEPGALQVHHTCDNPPCCNPRHLSVGTAAENASAMVLRGRSTAGSRHPQAKLTPEMVRQIRRARANGERNVDVAIRFGISKQQASAIHLNRFWRAA